MNSSPEGPRLTAMGKLFILAFVAACSLGAYSLIGRRSEASSTEASSKPSSNNATTARTATTLKISYSSEKKRWLEWAVQEFAQSPEGSGITVELISRGSMEGARAIVAGTDKVHLWTPASSMVKDVLVTEWQIKNGNQPILEEESLALTPLVFVMWKDRHDAFVAKYGDVNFETLASALAETGGWGAIAAKPEWGFFKLGITEPTQSNSGLMALALMAAHHHKKTTALTPGDIANAQFQAWFTKLARGLSGLSNSSGTMMKEMVLKGPASYDCLLTYESTAVDYLANAEGRWGKLHLVYPAVNFWSDHPCYLLDTPWSGPAEKAAARAFTKFLMTDKAQRQALVHGFRPGEPSVPILAPDSPFKRLEPNGLRVEIPSVCQPPQAEAIINLLAGWQRMKP
jgi:ABC-type sulfate transport system substrate-binding protein